LQSEKEGGMSRGDTDRGNWVRAKPFKKISKGPILPEFIEDFANVSHSAFSPCRIACDDTSTKSGEFYEKLVLAFAIHLATNQDRHLPYN
jgi:hypothetical protein